MKLIMAGLDYEHADITRREALSFVAGRVSEIDRKIRAVQGISGAVLLSTCNRTELYLSVQDAAAPDPARLLCGAAGVPYEPFRDAFVLRAQDDAVRHLFAVACGLRSQILGEDQIVSQVTAAAALARDAGATDAVLETLFRGAVTAAKEVKTKLRLTAVPLSAASRGVEYAARALGTLAGARCLVIGNGEMGRLAAGLLAAQGAAVTVTLRTYRHGETVVPARCRTCPYDDRAGVADGCDLVVSATTSPHFTLTAAQVGAMEKKPRLLLDLSLPRDIEPAAGEYTKLINMDGLGGENTQSEALRAQAEQIIERHRARFYEWLAYRTALPAMDAIKDAVFARVYIGDGEEDTLRAATDRTVELLLGGLKGQIALDGLTALARRISGREEQEDME